MVVSYALKDVTIPDGSHVCMLPHVEALMVNNAPSKEREATWMQIQSKVLILL